MHKSINIDIIRYYIYKWARILLKPLDGTAEFFPLTKILMDDNSDNICLFYNETPSPYVFGEKVFTFKLTEILDLQRSASISDFVAFSKAKHWSLLPRWRFFPRFWWKCSHFSVVVFSRRISLSQLKFRWKFFLLCTYIRIQHIRVLFQEQSRVLEISTVFYFLHTVSHDQIFEDLISDITTTS